MEVKQNDGVAILLARMETNPEEFYGDGGQWRFIYRDHFRDVLTEHEKASIHTKLKEIRRAELTSLVMETMGKKVVDTKNRWGAVDEERGFAQAPVLQEGQPFWGGK